MSVHLLVWRREEDALSTTGTATVTNWVLSLLSQQDPLVQSDGMNSPSARGVVDALISEQLLAPATRERSLGVVAAALRQPQGSEPGAASGAAPPPRKLPQLVEVVAYFGGALVLAAGALFLAQEWDGLGYPTRVTMLAVVMVVLAIAGAVSARVPAGVTLRESANDSRRRLSGTLLTGAALTAAFLVGLVVDHHVAVDLHEIYWPAVAGGTLGLVVAALGYRLAPTALGVLGMLAGLVTALMNLVSGVDDFWMYGVALFLVGVLWLVLAEAGVFREVTVARFAGVATALFGAQMPVADGVDAWIGYLLTLVVVIVGIALYLRTTAWPYLAVAVGAVTLLVPEVVSDWTEGSLGAIGAVLVTGVTLLIASFAGYRLRAETTEDVEGPPASPST